MQGGKGKAYEMIFDGSHAEADHRIEPLERDARSGGNEFDLTARNVDYFCSLPVGRG
jgi:hypothetical protein